MTEIEQTLYHKIGGSEGLKKIVDTFYFNMDTLPEAKEIRQQHQTDLSEANEKLFEFLSGWLGGPSLYIEKHGHPRLRARHLPFKIGPRERDQWMLCMQKSLDQNITSELDKKEISTALYRLADHMRNQPES